MHTYVPNASVATTCSRPSSAALKRLTHSVSDSPDLVANVAQRRARCQMPAAAAVSHTSLQRQKLFAGERSNNAVKEAHDAVET
eukprot:3554339-Rhodomonas_salina.2